MAKTDATTKSKRKDDKHKLKKNDKGPDGGDNDPDDDEEVDTTELGNFFKNMFPGKSRLLLEQEMKEHEDCDKNEELFKKNRKDMSEERDKKNNNKPISKPPAKQSIKKNISKPNKKKKEIETVDESEESDEE